MNPIDHAINSAPKYFICEGTMSPHVYFNQNSDHAVLKFSLLCLPQSQGLSYLLAYSRRHGIKSYGFKCHLCQFIATACEYLLGVIMHLLSMLHASFKFILSWVVEWIGNRGLWGLKDLAVGHSWWLAVPGFLIRPASQVQGSTSSMAAAYTMSLALISSHGAISFTWRSSKKIHHVIFVNAFLFTQLPRSAHQSHPGSPASLRSWFSVNRVQSVAFNSYLSNRKWNLKETRPPGKSRWKLLLMGHGGNFSNKCFRTRYLLK